jgi:pyridoxamine 5'-phosphate oxidase
MIKTDLAQIRQSYTKASLDSGDLDVAPISQFKKWFDQALKAEIDEVNAMTLATVDEYNQPDARIVLLKTIDEEGFVFFTNYNSAKGQQLANNKQVSLVFFWKELERQVRIKGIVEKISAANSDTYFYSRPIESQLGALASEQSAFIKSRTELEEKYAQWTKEPSSKIVRPAHWGGYIVKPTAVEFWQGRASRLHDRILYKKKQDNNWEMRRLQP